MSDEQSREIALDAAIETTIDLDASIENVIDLDAEIVRVIDLEADMHTNPLMDHPSEDDPGAGTPAQWRETTLKNVIAKELYGERETIQSVLFWHGPKGVERIEKEYAARLAATNGEPRAPERPWKA
jgi:hypothetical protein